MPHFNCAFEVFGKVQGVFFRKYTRDQATKLGLVGWCMNTRENTVKGEIEGPEDKINEMKVWLERTGSPSSNISKAVFSQLRPIETLTYTEFKIRK